MKNFEYKWDDKYFLLHIQLNNDSLKDYMISINRFFKNKTSKIEKVNIYNISKSHRFIVSRTRPEEEKFIISYPKDMILEAFYIDDRAYYPTESFHKG
jgi:hypothetical protein